MICSVVLVVPARDRIGQRGPRHRIQWPDQVAGPGGPLRCGHCRREVGRAGRSSAWRKWASASA